MPLDQSGRKSRINARTAVAASDAVYPSGVAQAGSIAVPFTEPGSIIHVLVHGTATGAGLAAVVTLFGYVTELNRWYVLAQLNSGGGITTTTATPVADGNDLHYSETFLHIGAFDRLYPQITSIAGAGAAITIDFVFEV